MPTFVPFLPDSVEGSKIDFLSFYVLEAIEGDGVDGAGKKGKKGAKPFRNFFPFFPCPETLALCLMTGVLYGSCQRSRVLPEARSKRVIDSRKKASHGVLARGLYGSFLTV